MEYLSFLVLALLPCLTTSAATVGLQKPAGVYIVHVSKSDMPAAFVSHTQWYYSALASVKGLRAEEFTEELHGPIYTYRTIFHGFAAKLTGAEAAAIEKFPGFLATFPDVAVQLHTTRTPQFMGLNLSYGLWPVSDYGETVIVGVLDTGVWPERPSFKDQRLSPVPSRWKGVCESGVAFNASLCNRKLIGARAFYNGYESQVGPINQTTEYRSPRDKDGHGSHTASTAAGNYAYDASLLGYAKGISRGVATRARLAVYKVCWADAGCFSSDILAALEQAVKDGVDILSLSLGSQPLPYYLDPIAIGAFGAMEHGILVSCSAGNSGPFAGSVSNVAPWILTVAASSIDRDFPAPVTLGNGGKYLGVSLYSGKGLEKKQLRLVYAANASLGGDTPSGGFCSPGSLNPKLVIGKIVLCDRGLNARTEKGMVVAEAGGAGMILANAEENGEGLVGDSHLLPATNVGYKEGMAIKKYIAKTPKPTATIAFLGTREGVRPAPEIASFSSRGPNPLTPEILKPDITAPGVNILAAWTGAIGPTGMADDKRVVNFNIISGTSMSCPHASGLAALLKGAYPHWSPAAIKSAIMTSGNTIDNTGRPLNDDYRNLSDPFGFGSGHVNSHGALDPGLVYDMGVQDYVDFLCSLKYEKNQIKVFTKGAYKCSKSGLRPGDLNYPSFSLVFDQAKASKFNVTFSRTLTNVGHENSVYKVSVAPPQKVVVVVKPSTLKFTRTGEKLSYEVTFLASSWKLDGQSSVSRFGSIAWSDEVRHVKSPIAFTWQNNLLDGLTLPNEEGAAQFARYA